MIRKNEFGWSLQLFPRTPSRAVETFKMAVALHKAKVPFYLLNAKKLLAMLASSDFIGIVPKNIPVEIGSIYFPCKDNIYEYIYLGVEKKKKY